MTELHEPIICIAGNTEELVEQRSGSISGYVEAALAYEASLFEVREQNACRWF